MLYLTAIKLDHDKGPYINYSFRFGDFSVIVQDIVIPTDHPYVTQ